MKFVYSLTLIAAVVARPTLDEYKEKKAQEKADAADAAANNAKMGAVNKVIKMMESLQAQVIAEGEKEAKTFDKFACFCKTMKAKKNAAIKKESDAIAEAEGHIEALDAEEADLDEAMSVDTTDISTSGEDKAKLKRDHKAALKEYMRNSADVNAAVKEVVNAMKVMKSMGKSLGKGSFVQTKNRETVQNARKTVESALLLADALGFASAEKAKQAFVQIGEDPPMESFDFHSEGIISMLEKLVDDFRKQKNELDMAEEKRLGEYRVNFQENKDFTDLRTHELGEHKDTKSDKEAEEADEVAALHTEQALYQDDTTYLSQVSDECDFKSATYDQRTKLRMNELAAITQAMAIVKTTVSEKTGSATMRLAQVGSKLHVADAVAHDEDAMEALEAEAEETEGGAQSFLQKRRVRRARQPADSEREKVISLLTQQGEKLKSSALMKLVSKIRADPYNNGPFAKIKNLIQNLIEQKLSEAAKEANAKGYCDKQTEESVQKRDTASDKVDQTNAKMAKLEGKRDKLKEELSTLKKEIDELNSQQKEGEQIRHEEHEENAETVKEAKEGLEATQSAITLLNRFYKTAAKEQIDQSALSDSQKDFKAGPDTGFDKEDSYNGHKGAGDGIVAMMEVIASDFQRTIDETQSGEKAAAKDHANFMTETSMSLAEKTTANSQKKTQLADTEGKLAEADDFLTSQTEVMNAGVEELINLKTDPNCLTATNKQGSYDERKDAREQEIEALKTALDTLNGGLGME